MPRGAAAALGAVACAALGLARGAAGGLTCLDGNYPWVVPAVTGATCDDLEASDPGTWSYGRAARPPQDLCVSDLWEGTAADKSFALVSLSDAQAMCDGYSTHLCSVDEAAQLLAKDAFPATLWYKSSGSKLSSLSRQLWSSTPCATAATNMVFKLDGSVSCANPSGEYAAVCCSSSKVRATECKKCPRTTKSVVSGGGVQSCSCDSTSTSFSYSRSGVLQCTDKRSLSLSGCAANKFGVMPSNNACSSAAPWNGGSWPHPSGGSCKVYVQYNAPGPNGVDGNFQCPSTAREKFIDYDFAYNYCQSLNARLCTVAELAQQPVEGRGGLLQCTSETAAGGIWSRDRCFGASESYFVYSLARKAKSCVAADVFSSSSGARLGFRCCADNSTAAAACDACPGNATSPAGATSWSQCSCPPTQLAPGGDCYGPLSAPGACPADHYNKLSANSCSRLASKAAGRRVLLGGGEQAEQEQEPPRKLATTKAPTTKQPTKAPTTKQPTNEPTGKPTKIPTDAPTNRPTTQAPTTGQPSQPTATPTAAPPGTNWVYAANGKTCAAIADGEGGCLGDSASYAAAKSRCETMGARLCTAGEVRANALSRFAGGACGANIWVRTSEPCCETIDGVTSCLASSGHVGISLFGNKESCISDSASYKTACCADDNIGNAGCGACPKGTVAAGSGKGDVKTRCQCPSGNFFEGTGCVSNAINTNLKCDKKNQYRGSHKALNQQENLKLVESREANYGGKKVAATSQPPDVFPLTVPACSTTAALTFTQAKNRCESIGARLCSGSKELHVALLERNDPCARRDKAQMWTSRPCGTNAYWTSSGTPADDKCVSSISSSKAALACCFDLARLTCYSCPTGSTLPAGAPGGLESCSCATGYVAGDSSNDVDVFCAA
jgi:hypothetical protein